jgi:hypothetical protein
MQQLGHSFTSDRRDNAELGKMSPDGIDHRGLLADERTRPAKTPGRRDGLPRSA